MIASRDGEAVAVHRARNAADSALRYEMDPMEQYELQTAIEDAGLDLGAIYHSHTRSDPVPSQTDINLAKLGDSTRPRSPGTLYLIVGVKGAGGRPAPVVDRRQPRRAGRAPGDGVSPPLVCPSCDRAHEAHERFCDDCGLPLVHATGRAPPRSELAAARPQGPPELRRGAAGARRLGAQPGRGGADPGPAARGGHPVARAPLGRLRRAGLPGRRPARHPRPVLRRGRRARDARRPPRPAAPAAAAAPPAVGARAGASRCRADASRPRRAVLG